MPCAVAARTLIWVGVTLRRYPSVPRLFSVVLMKKMTFLSAFALFKSTIETTVPSILSRLTNDFATFFDSSSDTYIMVLFVIEKLPEVTVADIGFGTILRGAFSTKISVLAILFLEFDWAKSGAEIVKMIRAKSNFLMRKQFFISKDNNNQFFPVQINHAKYLTNKANGIKKRINLSSKITDFILFCVTNDLFFILIYIFFWKK